MNLNGYISNKSFEHASAAAIIISEESQIDFIDKSNKQLATDRKYSMGISYGSKSNRTETHQLESKTKMNFSRNQTLKGLMEQNS